MNPMRAGLGLLLGIVLMGCATKPPAAAPETLAPSRDSSLAIRNQGYSLLYKLLSDEKNVSKLLVVKNENFDVGELIKKIARTTGAAAKELEAFAKGDPHLHLNIDGLPVAEKETRELIAKTRAKELVTKTGEKFELRILLTQIEAMSYGAHLAVVVQSHETDESRRKFLGDVSQQLQELHQAIIDLMHARWQMSAQR
jgi:hypothetical protein